MNAGLLRHALAVNQSMFALGNETFEADGGVFVRNRELPLMRDANHVAHVTARTPKEIDRLLARVEREFAGLPHRRFDLDPLTPPEFEARLVCDGYRPHEMLYQLLEGELRLPAKPHDVRVVDSDAAWRDYEELNRIDWEMYNETLDDNSGRWTADVMFRNRRIKSPPARFWLAYVEALPVSFLASWEGTEGVGLVDDISTHAEYRHRGLATALIHRGVADCRSRGAGPVVVVADPHDTPREMYEALGFRPVAIKRIYWKVI
jgi:GNAT superfamily N-acetyltransferase